VSVLKDIGREELNINYSFKLINKEIILDYKRESPEENNQYTRIICIIYLDFLQKGGHE
jgi:hypothetical protein